MNVDAAPNAVMGLSLSNERPVAVVVGAAGFIGSFLCEALIAQNCQVVAIDNLTTGNKKNIEKILADPHFLFFEHDINNSLPNLSEKVNYVFHLAGIEEYINGIDVSMSTLLVNSLGTRNLLEFTKSRKAKFLLASTIDLYSGILSAVDLKYYFGTSQSDAQHFTHHEAKRFSEALTLQYYKKFDMDIRIARLADVYGPRMDLQSGTIIAKLIKQTMEEEHLSIEGDGLQILHPTFVSDVVYGLSKAMLTEGTSGGIFNLVSSDEVTILQFASQLIELLPKKKPIEYTQKSETLKLPVHKIELEKSYHQLGWRARVKLNEGLEQTLRFFTVVPGAPAQLSDTQPLPKAAPIIPPAPLPPPPPAVPQKVNTTSGAEPVISLKTKVDQPTKNSLQIVKNLKPEPTSATTIHSKMMNLVARLIIATVLSVVFLVSTLVVIFGVQGWQGFLLVKETVTQIERQQFDQASGNASRARFALENSRAAVVMLQSVGGWVGVGEYLEPIEHTLLFGRSVAGALSDVSQVGRHLSQLAHTVSQKESDPLLPLANAKHELEQANSQLFQVEAMVKNLTPTPLISMLFPTQLDQLKLQITQTREQLIKIQGALDIFPLFFGIDRQKKYLLLFQNNAELRPGGGFIGSYGILSTEGGHLVDLAVSDVYVADGQLAEVIEPPMPLKVYLDQSRWYLRDSNWSLDFPTNAYQAQLFLEKETGQQVDGVIALDLEFLKRILKATGPVVLSDFGGVVSSENFFDKAEYYSEVGFFPGSTTKGDFLGALSRQLLLRLESADEGVWVKVVGAMEQSLLDKHLLLWSGDKQVQEVVYELGWDGAILRTPGCDSAVEMCDYLAVVEANIGANKANYFLKRSIDVTSVVGQEGQVSHKLAITYHNQSPSQTWPAGRYRAWVRLLVPSASRLTAIDTGSEASTITQVVGSQEDGLQSYGFLVQVAVGETKTVIIEYQSAGLLPVSVSQTVYKLTIQKQPGTAADPLAITMEYPAYLRLIKSSPPGAVAKEKTISYTTTLATDQRIALEFTK